MEKIIKTIEQIEDGYETIELFRELYFRFKDIDALKEKFKKLQREYFDKYSVAELKDEKIEKRNGKRTYDFNGIQEWIDIDEEKKRIEAKLKGNLQRDALEEINQDTGEIIFHEVPKVKFAKDSIIFNKF